MKIEKFYYLDGLRGLAAFIVVIHHYVLGFYPRYFFDEPISKTPINLFFNGNFPVTIFFTLSGYVLSYKFFKTKDINVIVESATKRYFRLLIPVLVSIISAYLLLKFNLFSNKDVAVLTGSSMWLSTFYNFEANFFEALKQGLYRVFLYGETHYNVNLWTMYLEFFGSLLTFAFLALFGNLRKRFLIYLILCFFMYKTYYFAFLLGIILSDIKNSKFNKKVFSQNKFTLFSMFISSLFLGSYPPGDNSDTIYAFLNLGFLSVDYFQFYHILGGFILVYVVLASRSLQNLLSKRIMLFLGKISFSLYVFHLIILCSFSTSLFKNLLDFFTFKISFIITFASSVALLIPLSYLSYKYFDILGIKFGNKAYTFLDSDKEITILKEKNVS